MILRTSNKFKKLDYEKMNIPNLTIMEGEDNPEVSGTIEEVIIYKTLIGKPNELVEDTTIKLDEIEHIDIKHTLNKLPQKKNLFLYISIGYNKDETIEVFQGITEGYLINTDNLGPTDKYDINDYFIPKGYDKPLSKIEEFSTVSPRARAIKKLKDKKPDFIIDKSNIKEWKGEWQEVF